MQNSKVNNTVGAYTAQISQQTAISQAIAANQATYFLNDQCLTLAKRLGALATCNDNALLEAHKEATRKQLAALVSAFAQASAQLVTLEKMVQQIV